MVRRPRARRRLMGALGVIAIALALHDPAATAETHRHRHIVHDPLGLYGPAIVPVPPVVPVVPVAPVVVLPPPPKPYPYYGLGPFGPNPVGLYGY